jgi:alpha 1,2-mannosyltransferase
MYLRFGALFFPDALISGQHLTVWKLLNTTCGRDEFEMDSGALLVNKKRVWDALYITKLMNDQHELFYKLVKGKFSKQMFYIGFSPLQFSGGDKDTFRLAFRFLGVKYYMVGILCSVGSTFFD